MFQRYHLIYIFLVVSFHFLLLYLLHIHKSSYTEFYVNVKADHTLKKVLLISDTHIGSKELTNLKTNLTNLSLDITGTNSFDECQVTTGGIPLTEINLFTMESKKEKGLYITGELLDVDGDCGGYNLTFAWITGILAGSDNND